MWFTGLSYQNAPKSVKAAYFSNLIESNHSNPKVLFSVIRSVVNPSVNTLSVATNALCEDFLLTKDFLQTKSPK